MNRLEKLSAIIMGLFGIGLVLNVFIKEFFDFGAQQNTLSLIYCALIVSLAIKFNTIVKNKFVMIPLYIMIIQTSYSLITNYII